MRSPGGHEGSSSYRRRVRSRRLSSDRLRSLLGEEGLVRAVRYAIHRQRERSAKLHSAALARHRKARGAISCEACGHNSLKVYGFDYIECHHAKLVSSLSDGDVTRIENISLLCANCHRIIHRARPWVSVEQLKIAISHRVHAELAKSNGTRAARKHGPPNLE